MTELGKGVSPKDVAFVAEVKRLLVDGPDEPAWRITIEGKGPDGPAWVGALSVILDDGFLVRYEEFPLYVVDGEVTELSAVREFSSPNADRSGREETSHRTGHCNVHGYYGWRETERASTNPTCPGCIRETGGDNA